MPRKPIHDDKVIFDYIVSYKSANDGLSPSRREIKAQCGISSTSVVASVLSRLEDEGKIELVGEAQSRGIKVIGGLWNYTPEGYE